jgi:hypothetical protein
MVFSRLHSLQEILLVVDQIYRFLFALLSKPRPTHGRPALSRLKRIITDVANTVPAVAGACVRPIETASSAIGKDGLSRLEKRPPFREIFPRNDAHHPLPVFE